MNIQTDVVNRALARVGEQPIADDDRTSIQFNRVKKQYLATILESLSEYPWTSAMKRARLIEITEGENLSEYAYRFTMPIDCAKPLALLENVYFKVEGSTLYTDDSTAILLYVTNGALPAADQNETDIYPEYSLPDLEAKFWEHIESRLAGKLALEITGKEDLYQVLTADAIRIAQDAIKASKSSSAAKKNGSTWWIDLSR